MKSHIVCSLFVEFFVKWCLARLKSGGTDELAEVELAGQGRISGSRHTCAIEERLVPRGGGPRTSPIHVIKGHFILGPISKP